MWKRLRRHHGPIIFGLTILVVVLITANAWRYGYISASWLKQEKDSLAALSSVATMLIFVAGGLFSYYRFFRGRLLSLRADLEIEVSVHPATEDYNIHSILLRAKNVGSATIWHPAAHIDIRIHGPATIAKNEVIDTWYTPESPVDGTGAFSVIEPDEKVSFFAIRNISSTAWAVTYMASVSADSGDVWFVARTFTNRPINEAD